MPADPSNIFVPQMARLWLAPVGTVAPDGPTVVMPTGWTDVGLFTPDSLQWATDPAFETVNSHQANFPTRRFQTGDAATVQVDLQEWKRVSFQAVYGGGTFTTVTPSGGGTAYHKFTPPAIGGRTETAVCIELADGAHLFRRLIPRALQIEGVTQSFSRTAESTLPLRLAVLGSDVSAAFYDVSTSASLAPAA